MPDSAIKPLKKIERKFEIKDMNSALGWMLGCCERIKDGKGQVNCVPYNEVYLLCSFCARWANVDIRNMVLPNFRTEKVYPCLAL